MVFSLGTGTGVNKSKFVNNRFSVVKQAHFIV